MSWIYVEVCCNYYLHFSYHLRFFYSNIRSIRRYQRCNRIPSSVPVLVGSVMIIFKFCACSCWFNICLCFLLYVYAMFSIFIWSFTTTTWYYLSFLIAYSIYAIKKMGYIQSHIHSSSRNIHCRESANYSFPMHDTRS
jgi:hypothetical protein